MAGRIAAMVAAGLLALLPVTASAQPVQTPEEARLLEITGLAERDPDAAVSQAQRWLEQAQRGEDRYAQAYARIALGSLHRRRGHYDVAAVEQVTARDLAARLELPTLNARVNAELGTTYAMAGLHGEALEAQRQALAGYLLLQDWARASGVLGNIGNSLDAFGDREAARSHYQQALQMKRERGIHRGIAGLLNNLADLEQTAGRPKEAIALFEQALLAVQKEVPSSATTATLVRSNLAQVLAETGQFAAAHAQLEAAEQRRPIDDQRVLASIQTSRARVLLTEARSLAGSERSERLDRALSAQLAAADTSNAIDDPERRAKLAELGSDIQAERGEWQVALELLREAQQQRDAADERVRDERYAVLAAQYRNERSERELAELREREVQQRGVLERERGLALAALGAVVLLLGVALVQGRRARDRRAHGKRLEAHNHALEIALNEAEAMRQRAERYAGLNTRLLQLAGDDLRTPLLQIRNVAEKLLVERASDVSLSRQVAAVAQAASQLMRTSEQMIETGALGPAEGAPRAPVDLVQLTTSVVAEAQSRLGGRRRTLQLDVLGTPRASVDGARLQLTLHELLQLALDLNPGVENMRVSVARRDATVEIAIDDPRGVLRQRLAGERVGQIEEMASVTLGLLWISSAASGLGGELGFDAPGAEQVSRVWLRVPAAD